MHSYTKQIAKGVALLVLLAVFVAPISPLIPNVYAQTTDIAKTTQGPANPDDIGCGLKLSAQNFAICISSIVYYITVGLTSTIAYIAAYFFDLAVKLSLQSESYSLEFISVGWTTVRDLANMAFIFILVYIALTIIFLADTANTQKKLVGLIVVALVVNFSFFATRIVIDAGNIVAVQFYNAINVPTIGETASGGIGAGTPAAGAICTGSNLTASGSACNTKDLTASIMKALGVADLLNTPSFRAYVKDTNSSAMYTLITLSLIYISIGIMFAILAGSFLFAGAKFIMRIVGLWFLIIASPLAFVAAGLAPTSSKVGEYFHKWLDYLIKYSFYPAIYLFMFLMLTIFMSKLGQQNLLASQNFFGNVPTANSAGTFLALITTAIANIAIRMGFVVAMLYICLSAAEMLVSEGSGYAKSFQRWAFGAMAGTAGLVGRNTIGFAARRARGDKIEFPKLDLANRLRSTRDWVADSRFDVRKTPGIKQIISGIEKVTGEASQKYGALPINFGESSDLEKKRKELDAKKLERANILRDKANREAIRRLAENKNPPGSKQHAEDTERVKGLSKRDLEALKTAELESIAHLLSENQIRMIKDGAKPDADKDKVEKKWEVRGTQTAPIPGQTPPFGSPQAPINRADEIVKKLQDIDTTLKAIGPGGLGGVTAAGIDKTNTISVTMTGTDVNGTKIQTALKSIDSEILTVQSQLGALARTPASVPERRHWNDKLLQLNTAKQELKDLDEQRKKIKATTTGATGAGQFVVR